VLFRPEREFLSVTIKAAIILFVELLGDVAGIDGVEKDKVRYLPPPKTPKKIGSAPCAILKRCTGTSICRFSRVRPKILKAMNRGIARSAIIRRL